MGARSAFQPHQDLDGVTVAEPSDFEWGSSYDGWPEEDVPFPGDHDGCCCDLTPVLVGPSDSGDALQTVTPVVAPELGPAPTRVEDIVQRYPNESHEAAEARVALQRKALAAPLAELEEMAKEPDLLPAAKQMLEKILEARTAIEGASSVAQAVQASADPEATVEVEPEEAE